MKKTTLIVAIIANLMMVSAFADNNLSVTFTDRQTSASNSTQAGTHFSAVITNISSKTVTVNNVTFGAARNPNAIDLSNVIADSGDPNEQNYLLHSCNGTQLVPHTSCSIPLLYIWPTTPINSQLLQVNAVSAATPAPAPSSGSINVGANSGLSISFTDANNQPLSANALSNLKDGPAQLNFNAVITNTGTQAATINQAIFNNSLTTTGLSDISANAASDPTSQTTALQSCNGKVLAAGASCSIPLAYIASLSLQTQEILNVAISASDSLPNIPGQSDILPMPVSAAINIGSDLKVQYTDYFGGAYANNQTVGDPTNVPNYLVITNMSSVTKTIHVQHSCAWGPTQTPGDCFQTSAPMGGLGLIASNNCDGQTLAPGQTCKDSVTTKPYYYMDITDLWVTTYVYASDNMSGIPNGQVVRFFSPVCRNYNC